MSVRPTHFNLLHASIQARRKHADHLRDSAVSLETAALRIKEIKEREAEMLRRTANTVDAEMDLLEFCVLPELKDETL